MKNQIGVLTPHSKYCDLGQFPGSHFSFLIRVQSCLNLCNSMDYVACQGPLSMGFLRQEYCSGEPLPSPRNLSNPVYCIAGRFFTIWATREAPCAPRGNDNLFSVSNKIWYLKLFHYKTLYAKLCLLTAIQQCVYYPLIGAIKGVIWYNNNAIGIWHEIFQSYCYKKLYLW